jgi:hypothetical protein
VFFAQSNSFLPILQLPTQLNSSAPKLISLQAAIASFVTLLYNHFAQATQKTVSVVKEACLLIRCLAMDVLLLHAFASGRVCLPNRCLAMVIRITILSFKSEYRITRNHNFTCVVMNSSSTQCVCPATFPAHDMVLTEPAQTQKRRTRSLNYH